MLTPWLTLFDFRSLFFNFKKLKRIDRRYKCNDFVILIPIFNNVKYLTNISFLKKYSRKVVLCTTNLETEKFYKDLEKIAKENKFQIIKTIFEDNVKNPWKIYHKTLLAHDYVLGKTLDVLEAKYVIYLDADTTCKTNLSILCGAMEKEDYDLVSVKVIPSKKKTITENLQYIEYQVAMKSRRVYPWLTSGAAMAGKRDSLIQIMDKHSLFFNGGDIEIGKIANMSGLKIGHVPVTFYTDVPETFPKLVKQRFSWFCGAFRHSIINMHTNLFNPMYAVYFIFLIFLMLPFKIMELLLQWEIIPFLMLFYLIVMYVLNWEIRSRYMLLFPFYSLFQVIVMPWCGIHRYIKTVMMTKNFGFIKTFYKKGYSVNKYITNIGFIALLIFLIFNMGKISDITGISKIGIFNIYNEGLEVFLILMTTFILLIGGFIIKNKMSKLIKFFTRKIAINYTFINTKGKR